MKYGCVIQGDVRQGLRAIFDKCLSQFDVVILSTWEEERNKLPPGRYELVVSERPPVAGESNRNLQRVSTAAGIQCARAMGCSHVLKWRTDLLPTRLDLSQLQRWSEYNPPPDLRCRLVMPAHRNLSVEPDWFSSFPDLFAYSDIGTMELLWGLDGIDLSVPFNFPKRMVEKCGVRPDYGDRDGGSFYFGDSKYFARYGYDAHIELYAHFKDRLERLTDTPLDHRTLASSYLHLIDHERLGICWFRRQGRGRKRFRAIQQSARIPWWTENSWAQGLGTLMQFGVNSCNMTHKLSFRERIMDLWGREREVLLQRWWFLRYMLQSGTPGFFGDKLPQS